MPISCSNRRARHLRRVILVSAFAVASGQPAGAQQVGVSVLPSAQRIQWSDAFALTDDYLYGGRVALHFGQWVELQPFYFQRNGMGLDTARAGSVFGSLSAGRAVDVKHYGSNVQFNLSDAAFVPFARVGAGVLRMEPDSAERQDRITVSAGGGVRFGFAGLNAEVYAEQMGFRMNPRSLFGPDTTTGAGLTTLRNLVYGAAVTIPLSTRREDEGNAGGLSGSTAPLEPFVGWLRYAGAHNLPNLEVAGVRAGIDFSPVFGMRGFYWRGVNDDRDGPAPVAGYGGEAQFNLSTGAGLSPFLVVGAGQIDYKDTFADSLGMSRVDKTAFILGAGASFRLTDRLRLNGAIRDYVMTVDDNLDNVAGTGDLTHNTMLSAGLTISFGGRSTPSSAQREREYEAERRAARTERDLRERELVLRDARPRDPRTDRSAEDTVGVVRERSVMVRGGPPVGPSWITIPVPTQGEIILRYGMSPRTGGTDSGMVRRDTVMMPPDTPTSSDLAAELREVERRLLARIDALQRPAALPTVTMIPPGATDVVVRDRDGTPLLQRFQQTRAADLRPYIGLGYDGSDARFIVGSRADLGPVRPGSPWHFVPELAVGLGSGTMSVLAFANAQYAFGSVGGSRTLRPYATVGAGIYSPTVLGINTAIGTSYALRPATESPLFLTLEVQGINLFSETRALFGLSRRW